MSQMKKKIPTIIITTSLIGGLCLLLYPTVSNWWNSFRQTSVISKYIEDVKNIDDNKYKEILEEAENYNNKLAMNGLNFVLSNQEMESYNCMLNFSSSNIMGYIEIPSIDVKLALYHGTSDDALAVGVRTYCRFIFTSWRRKYSLSFIRASRASKCHFVFKS